MTHNCSSMFEFKKFDEEKFLSECFRKFSDIRNECNLDDETLRLAQEKPLLEHYVMPVKKGCTVDGIKEMAKKAPDFDVENRLPFFGGFVTYSYPIVFDMTEEKIRCMYSYYWKKCGVLRSKIEQVERFEEIIKVKEEKVSNGDVAAMFFLGKAYEEGRFCVKDVQKSLSYYQKAKDTWAGDLSRRYEEWLDKAVQDSGHDMIGRMGREYIAGTFAEEGAKNRDCKLKKETKWLNKAIEAGDGWAAFTKANICYYGYGRWKKRKQEAYNNYLKAAQSKNSIYALELGEMCLGNGATHTEVVLKAVEAFNR